MEVPTEVKKRFMQLKSEYPFYISLEKIKDKFYVYRSRSLWDRESKRVRTQKKYLGRIKEDGGFVAKKVYPGEEENEMPEWYKTKGLDKNEELILTHLSMNCRIQLTVLSQRTGLSLSAIEYKKKSLEKRFKIRYLAGINYIMLGFSEFIIYVKFTNEKPFIEDIKAAIEKSPYIQSAMMMQGDYDMAMFALAENAYELSEAIFKLRNDEKLAKYEAIWDTVIISDAYGYLPLREEFFELLKKRVWHRTKETPRPSKGDLTEREYMILKELNANGDIPFAVIDSKYGLGTGAAKYTFEKLKDKNLIIRETLTMRNCDIKYNALIMVDILDKKEFLRDREKFLRYIIKDYNGPINRFTYAINTFYPDGFMFIMPVMKEGELEEETTWLKQQIKGIKIRTSISTRIIVGELCYRKFDNNYSSQMQTLISVYKAESPKLTDYKTYISKNKKEF